MHEVEEQSRQLRWSHELMSRRDEREGRGPRDLTGPPAQRPSRDDGDDRG